MKTEAETSATIVRVSRLELRHVETASLMRAVMTGEATVSELVALLSQTEITLEEHP